MVLFTGRDPYAQLFALMGLLGTTAILIVQVLAALGVHRLLPRGAASATPTPTGSARSSRRCLGGLGMLYAIYLLIDDAGFAAGAAAE